VESGKDDGQPALAIIGRGQFLCCLTERILEQLMGFEEFTGKAAVNPSTNGPL
jgi:hypothetical protein